MARNLQPNWLFYLTDQRIGIMHCARLVEYLRMLLRLDFSCSRYMVVVVKSQVRGLWVHEDIF